MLDFIINNLLFFRNHILGWLQTMYSYTYEFSTNHKYIGIYIIAFLVLTLIIYILLYRLLKIDRNVFSYFSFTTIVISYIQGYKYVLNLEDPIYSLSYLILLKILSLIYLYILILKKK